MYPPFYTDNNIFIIDNFKVNTPLNIKTLDGHFLSCDATLNHVNFYTKDDSSGRQKWLIERVGSDFYIKSACTRYNFTQYLGAPNKNNQVFLYTSRNRYTKWNITLKEGNHWMLDYTGDKFNKDDITIVIARYTENIQWAMAYNDISIIYNKSSEIELPFQTVKYLHNYGREGHTYLYHIIKNYNNLATKTIFLQADPFIHNETILFGIDNHERTLPVQPLGLHYLKYHTPPDDILIKYKTSTQYGLDYLVIHVDENLSSSGPYFFVDPGIIHNVVPRYMSQFPGSESLVQNFLRRSKFPITKPLQNIRFTYSALFSVSKDIIRKWQPTVYENLLKELLSYNSQAGENGYILERLWLYIFE